ncbi:MAG: hypothetical protein ACYSW8_26950 [Planctomycetota bacterium]|jgi:hypothetical protein
MTLINPTFRLPTNGTETSDIAATSASLTAAALREKVYRYILDCGEFGATDEEIQFALNLPGNTQRPRRWELSHKEQKIVKRGTRHTRSGNPAAVWIDADLAPEILPESSPEPRASAETYNVRVVNKEGETEYDLSCLAVVTDSGVTLELPGAVTIYAGETIVIERKS